MFFLSRIWNKVHRDVLMTEEQVSKLRSSLKQKSPRWNTTRRVRKRLTISDARGRTPGILCKGIGTGKGGGRGTSKTLAGTSPRASLARASDDGCGDVTESSIARRRDAMFRSAPEYRRGAAIKAAVIGSAWPLSRRHLRERVASEMDARRNDLRERVEI